MSSSSAACCAPLPEARPYRCQQSAGLRQPGLAGHACEARWAAGPVLTFEGDSDAHIVRGLIAILFALYSGKSARDILATDALALFDRIGLRENLTPQRSTACARWSSASAPKLMRRKQP